MEKAWSVLEELGALDPDGNLTALGRHMVSTSSFLFPTFNTHDRIGHTACRS
jgi:hypothetical protein